MNLVKVRLRGVPLDIHRQATQHSEEVMREFAHMADDPESSHAPARLIFLRRQLEERFAPFTRGTQTELEDAIARGDKSIDVTYDVPSEVREAVRDLAALLDEVDAYCDAGEYLLALKTPRAALAYRRWFLEEFSEQASGRDPVPWIDSPHRQDAEA